MADRRIITYTGKYVTPLDLQADDIDIRDIAHSLSQLCRYTGHITVFYSVAEHCVLMAKAAIAKGWDSPLIRATLLHDASEAYVDDLPGPLKHQPMFAEYRRLEEDILDRILLKFNAPAKSNTMTWAAIKEMDTEIRKYEARTLFNSIPPEYQAELEAIPSTFKISIQEWHPRTAEREYLKIAEWIGLVSS